MPIYPYSFQLPPLNVQDIPNDGAPGEFLGINVGGALDWLPVSGGSGTGDLLAANNLSELTPTAGTARTNLGLGTSDSPTFANLTLTSPSLSSSAPVTISQTWDDLPTAFTALKVNATSTNSAAGSLLLDLQVSGVSKFNVSKNGVLGSSSYYLLTAAIFHAQGKFAGATDGALGSTNGAAWALGGSLGWSGTPGSAASVVDTKLERDGAPNTLALRNGAAAQTFNVYGTWSTAITNFERLAIKYNTTDVAYQIAAEKGTDNGDYRPLQLWTGGASRLHVTTAGNVGIGTTNPTAPLQIFKDSIADTTAAGINLLRRDFGGGDLRGAAIYSRYITGASADCLVFGVTGSTDTGKNPYSSFDQARMVITETGRVGIGTTSPTSKLHVAGSSSPSITVDNTLATGASQLLFKNTVVTGDTDGIFLNGSAQSGFGGNGSLNIKATTGPIAFHTNTVTNALSISQAGVATFASGINVTAAFQSGLNFVSRSKILCGADGTFLLTTNATTNFNRLNFGVQSDGFPALKISGNKLQVVLGSTDTTFTNIQGKLTTDTDYTATVVTPTGFLTLYDAQGIAYRVPCVVAP